MVAARLDPCLVRVYFQWACIKEKDDVGSKAAVVCPLTKLDQPSLFWMLVCQHESAHIESPSIFWLFFVLAQWTIKPKLSRSFISME